MKKTLNIINNYLALYTEQDDAAGVPPPPDATAPVPAALSQPPAAPADAPEVKPLSSEGEVLLVRLLKKALVMDLDENDINALESIGDINETTAKSALDKIMKIMQNYSQDVNIKL